MGREILLVFVEDGVGVGGIEVVLEVGIEVELEEYR